MSSTEALDVPKLKAAIRRAAAKHRGVCATETSGIYYITRRQVVMCPVCEEYAPCQVEKALRPIVEILDASAAKQGAMSGSEIN